MHQRHLSGGKMSYVAWSWLKCLNSSTVTTFYRIWILWKRVLVQFFTIFSRYWNTDFSKSHWYFEPFPEQPMWIVIQTTANTNFETKIFINVNLDKLQRNKSTIRNARKIHSNFQITQKVGSLNLYALKVLIFNFVSVNLIKFCVVVTLLSIWRGGFVMYNYINSFFIRTNLSIYIIYIINWNRKQ